MTSSQPVDLVLVETLHADVQRHHRAEIFPYLLALADIVGWTAQWLVVPVPPETMHVGTRYTIGLPDDVRAELEEALEALRPRLIVFHDRPTPELAEFVAQASGGGRVVDLTGFRHATPPTEDLVEHVGLGPVPDDVPTSLCDLEHPRFDRVALAGAPLSGRPVRLAGTLICPYRQPLATNPFFEGIDDPAIREYRGCSFCGRGNRDRVARESDPFAPVLRQILAHQRATPPSDQQHEYMLGDFSGELWRFLDHVLAAGIAPSTFTTMVRADQLVRTRERMEASLARMHEAGHRLSLISIGAENFSPTENLRFNKGVTPERLWECADLIEDWEQRFPQTFSCPDRGYFSAIIFTPWTRPEDLRANFTAGRRLGREWLRRALGTRLQLIHDTPIIALAHHDGLTDRRGSALDDIAAICVSDPNVEEVQWRFADERVARMHQVLVRLEPEPRFRRFPDDDPLYLEVREHRAGLVHALSDNLADLCFAVVDAIETVGPEAPVSEVFAWIAQRQYEYVPNELRPSSEADDDATGLAVESAARTMQIVHVAVGVPPIAPRTEEGYEFTMPIPFGGASHCVTVPGSAEEIVLVDVGSGEPLARVPARSVDAACLVAVHGTDGPTVMALAGRGEGDGGAFYCVAGCNPATAFVTFTRQGDETPKTLDARLASGSAGQTFDAGGLPVRLEVTLAAGADELRAFDVPLGGQGTTIVFLTMTEAGTPQAYVALPAGGLQPLSLSHPPSEPVSRFT